MDSKILPTDIVLDVGFFGQGMTEANPRWGHRMLRDRARDVYGVDIILYKPADAARQDHYKQASAEQFEFETVFDKIYAGDIIEHLSNPGMFLDACAKVLKPEGELILTTPNCFSLFNISEKIMHDEPTVNSDHTCYFNRKTLKKLLEKNNWQVTSIDYIYTLEIVYAESWKKKLLNVVYALLAKCTPKYVETLVIVATYKGQK